MSFKKIHPNQFSLAWRNLTYKKKRLALSVLGVAFAVIIMFSQIGILDSSVDSAIVFIEKMDADLLMVSKLKTFLANTEPFSKRRIYQAMAASNIKTAYPLYIETSSSLWKNPQNGKSSIIRVVGFQLKNQLLNIPEIYQHTYQLQFPHTAIIDRCSSTNFYGHIKKGVSTELAKRKINVVGSFSLGRDFVYQGNIIVSEENFAYFFDDSAGSSRLDQVEIGLIKSKSSSYIRELQQELQYILPNDVAIYTKQKFIEMETDYWIEVTAIGDIFGLGVLLGFVIGILICYQILYSDIMRHLKQFSTIKALGFSNWYVLKVILQQALFLAVMGFSCGFVISCFLYYLLGKQLNSVVHMKSEIAIPLFLITVIMCTVAGIIAARKALVTDPAELF